MTIADVRREVAEAARSTVEGDEGADGTVDTEAAASDATNSDASTEGQSANGSEAQGTTPEAAASGTVEAPDEYFGYKFPPELKPEERLELIEEFRKRDDHIGKLLRGKEEGAAPADAPAPEEPEVVTDEAILQALGLDPENPFMEETAKAILPVVRRQIAQETTISQLIEMQELAEIDRSWRSSLSGLEREFGALPGELDHETVMEYAAENSIGSPVDAYWRIVGPGRAAFTEAMKARTAAKTAEKQSATGTRPVSTSGDDEAPLESKTTKGATREAAARILREMGLGDN